MRMCEWQQIGTMWNNMPKESMEYFLNSEAGSTWWFHRLLQAIEEKDISRVRMYGCYTMSFRYMWE